MPVLTVEQWAQLSYDGEVKTKQHVEETGESDLFFEHERRPIPNYRTQGDFVRGRREKNVSLTANAQIGDDFFYTEKMLQQRYSNPSCWVMSTLQCH
jgi:hypothetical protein